MIKKLFMLFVFPLLAIGQFQFIPLSADYASFPASDSLAYIQVYLTTFQGNLQYVPEGNGVFKASFGTSLQISDGSTQVYQNQHEYVNTSRDTSRIRAFNQIMDLYNLNLPHGTYQATIVISDHNSQKTGEYQFELKTMDNRSDFILSDIELCTEIKPDTSQNMFYKNGLRVVPNARAVYDMLNPLLYYYLELENLSFNPDGTNLYNFSYHITNAAGDTVRKSRLKTKAIAADQLVEIGGMNVIALPKGVYFFNVHAQDLTSGNVQTARKKFIIYKPQKEDEAAPVATAKEIEDHYLGMTETDLDSEFKLAIYIVTSQERLVFKQLDNLLAKQKFLTQFWRRKDKENRLAPGTFRRVYLQRVGIANEKYRSMGREGWKTDMGRVFILYGEPDEYERHPNSIDMIPHVIWHFHNLEGGAIFVFADEDGFGSYRLIHSDYRKELQNPNWQETISKRTDSGQSPF